MKPRIILVLFLLCAASIAVLYSSFPTKAGRDSPTIGRQPRVQENYGKLPLAFEANNGQTDAQVKFISSGSGYTMFLTGNEAVLWLRPSSAARPTVPVANSRLQAATIKGGRITDAFLPSLIQNPNSQIQNSPTPSTESLAPVALRMKLVGANPEARVEGLDELPGKSNYFIGNDPKKWRTGVSNYSKVKYQNVYPGIDLVYYGNQRQLEYDFVVAPGVDPGLIKFDIDGAEGTAVNAHGDLVVQMSGGEVALHKPIVFQPAMGIGPSATAAFNHQSAIDNSLTAASFLPPIGK
jgi:hypothetical protein